MLEHISCPTRLRDMAQKQSQLGVVALCCSATSLTGETGRWWSVHTKEITTK